MPKCELSIVLKHYDQNVHSVYALSILKQPVKNNIFQTIPKGYVYFRGQKRLKMITFLRYSNKFFSLQDDRYSNSIALSLSSACSFCLYRVPYSVSVKLILNVVPPFFSISIVPSSCSTRIFTSCRPRESVFLKSTFSGKPNPLSETTSE